MPQTARPLWSAVIRTSIYTYTFLLLIELKVLCSGSVLALYTMVQYLHAPSYRGKGFLFVVCVLWSTHERMQSHPFQCFSLSACITEIPDQNHMNSDGHVTTYHTINFIVFFCPVPPPPPLSIGDAFIQSKASGTLCVQTHENTKDNNR
jgi:hypothetical protein